MLLQSLLLKVTQGFFSLFWEHDPIPRIWNFSQFYTNWGKTHTIYYNQIKQMLANKNISTL